MIDILYGQAFHRYLVRITKEHPNGVATVETEVMVSPYDSTTLRGKNALVELAREIEREVSKDLYEGYFGAVDIILEQKNVIIMN